LALCAGICLAATPLHGDVAAELAALRRQVAELQARIDVLASRIEDMPAEQPAGPPGPGGRDSAAAARIPALCPSVGPYPAESLPVEAPVLTAGPEGFRLHSADRAWELRVRASIQTDYRAYLDDGGVNNNDRFLMRRLRPSLEGRLGERVSFRVTPDLAPAAVLLTNAYGILHISPELFLLVGKHESPVVFENLCSQTNLIMVERGFPTMLGPDRDIGLQLFGHAFAGRLDYTVAALAGAQNNASVVTDPDDNIELAARLFSHPFRHLHGSVLRGLGGGYAITHGRQENTAPGSISTPGQQAGFRYRPGVQAAGIHTRHAPQGYWYAGPFGALLEYALSSQEVALDAARARLEHRAWQVMVNWMLSGEDATFGAVVPQHPVDPAAGQWGAWQLAARVQQVRLDAGAFPQFADPAQSFSRATAYGLALNWYLNRNLKASVLCEHTRFNADGADNQDRKDENILFSRMQLQF
jgi:phosphate-selective porin OprO/OprP